MKVNAYSRETISRLSRLFSFLSQEMNLDISISTVVGNI